MCRGYNLIETEKDGDDLYMSEFMIGCNYWGSKAGTEMWADWDESSVENDFRLMSEYGVKYARVFPNWRDFQPIYTIRGYRNEFHEYRLHGKELPHDEFALDEDCMEHFDKMCSFALKYDIKLIVSVITGWMSGRMFVPPALDGKNHITDPESLMWQNRFARGFVRRMKGQKAIVAWDLGNECNCMSEPVSRYHAYVWTSNVANAIRSEDNTRPVMSGMHSLLPDSGEWTVRDQGELTDMLTPHPYPSPTVGGDFMPMDSLPTTMIPTFQCCYYGGVGGKDAMIQEQGTFSSMNGNYEMASKYIRANLWSAYSNGIKGLLWWCAFEQLDLDFPPYTWSAVERELGMFYRDFTPKPVAKIIRDEGEKIRCMEKLGLEPKQTDAVYVITRQPDPKQPATSAFVLAKQAGFDITFVNWNMPLPDAKLYIVPSMYGWAPMDMEIYCALLEKAENGATVYFSSDTGLISELERVSGLESFGMKTDNTKYTFEFDSADLPLSYGKKYLLKSIDADVLMSDTDGTVMFSRHKFGNGKIYFLNAALEQQLWDDRSAFEDETRPYYKIYKEIASEILEDKPVRFENPHIGATYHKQSDKLYYIVAVNYSGKDELTHMNVSDGVKISAVMGNAEKIEACGAAVYKAELD